MEKRFPRASKTEAGGTKVISAWLFSCGALARDHPVRENPIAALKKNGFDSRRHSFFKARSLITDWDRFARRENPPNKHGNRLLLKQRNIGKVTTNHLLLRRQPGNTVALLPISQPNFELLGSKGNETRTGGGGG